MTILTILTYPDERLKSISDPVTDFDENLHSFINDLEETMRNSAGGVGIAAPQVGFFKRLIIF